MFLWFELVEPAHRERIADRHNELQIDISELHLNINK